MSPSELIVATRTLVVPMSMTRITVTTVQTKERSFGSKPPANPTADEPSPSDDAEIEERPKPVDTVARDEPNNDEDHLRCRVGADCGDETMAERKIKALHPSRAASTEGETADGSKHQPDRKGCRVTARSPRCPDRKWDCKNERNHCPHAERSGIPTCDVSIATNLTFQICRRNPSSRDS